MRLWAGSPRKYVSIHSRKKTLISISSRSALGPAQPPKQKLPKGLPLKGKAAGA